MTAAVSIYRCYSETKHNCKSSEALGRIRYKCYISHFISKLLAIIMLTVRTIYFHGRISIVWQQQYPIMLCT